MRFNLLCLALTFWSLSACASYESTAPQGGQSLALGCYRYAGNHSDSRSITGRLSVNSTQGSSFSGSLEAIEITPTGSSQTLSGVVTGQMLNTSNIDFTWSISLNESRRHLGPFNGQPGQWLNETLSQLGTYTLTPGCS